MIYNSDRIQFHFSTALNKLEIDEYERKKNCVDASGENKLQTLSTDVIRFFVSFALATNRNAFHVHEPKETQETPNNSFRSLLDGGCAVCLCSKTCILETCWVFLEYKCVHYTPHEM